MSDLIFKRNGEEYFCIPSPFSNNYYHLPKCPETKLEIKMTETIQQLKEDIAILQEKLNKLEEAEKEPNMMLMRQGKVDIVDYDTKTYYRIEYTDSFSGAYVWFVRRRGEDYIRQVRDVNVYGVLEDYYQKQVLKQKEDYPYKKYTPDEVADEVEWDEKDNPKPVDEVVNRLVKKYEAQKLFNRLVDELGYDFDACNDVVDLVEDWLPEPQSAAGSQNVDTELLVDGFNHCLQKMKEMLR